VTALKWVLIIIALVGFTPRGVSASDYTHFQSLNFTRSNVDLLHDFSHLDMRRYLNRIEDKRFWGWIVEPVHEHEKVSFIKETILMIDNAGTTPISQSYTLKVSEQSKIQYDARGQISTRIKGKVKGFDLNLETKLDLSYTNSTVKSIEERTQIDIEVDPGTSLRVGIYGEGYISNGVAKYFRFFRPVKEGGYEYFVLSTEYYSIEKVPLDRPAR
jgi:hypothetical protein